MRTITTGTASMHRSGLIAGLGLLLMAVLAGLATFRVLERVITEGDASRTVGDIIDALAASGWRSSRCSVLRPSTSSSPGHWGSSSIV